MPGIIAGIGPSGKEVPFRATADGKLPTDSDATGDDPAALLAELIWEVRALRRVQCKAHDRLFEEYPG